MTATVETDPVPNAGDAADDPAIWVNPADPSASTILGTDKQGGLAVYDLDGRELQYLPDGDLNNVDVRQGFPLGDTTVALVTAGDEGCDELAIYAVDPRTRHLEDVAARRAPTVDAYGACMYHSVRTGRFYSFVNSREGVVEQWELFDAGGAVDARRVRTFDVGTRTEGCVADDELGHLYVGEEAVGIWKYGAEPDDGGQRALVDGVGDVLEADVEGLTIVHGDEGTGFLMVSSQGDDSFAVYRREGGNAYVGKFRIGAGLRTDGVTDTDGIDATSAALGPRLPEGVFVVQDGHNRDFGRTTNQNYKLVPLQKIFGDNGVIGR